MQSPVIATAMVPVFTCRLVKKGLAGIPPALFFRARCGAAHHHPLRLNLEHHGERKVIGRVHRLLQELYAGRTRRTRLHLTRVYACQRSALIADRLDNAREVFLRTALVTKQRVDGVHACTFQVVCRRAALGRVLVAVHAHGVLPPVHEWGAAAVLRADMVRVNHALGPARGGLTLLYGGRIRRYCADKVEPYVDVLVVVLHDMGVQGQRHVVAVGS